MRGAIKRFAKIVSGVLEPMSVLSVTVLVGGWISGLRDGQYLLFIFYIVSFFGIVALLRLWMSRRWRIDWDISQRNRRVRPLLVLLGFVLLNWFVLRSWQNTALVRLFLLFIVWLAGFLLVTLRYKISGHVGIMTLALGLFWRWFGVAAWPLLLVVPIAAWSRLVLGRHTLKEVIGGAAYTMGVMTLFLYALWLIP